MFDYRTHAKNVSLYNTPPVIAVYMVRLTLEWLKRNGGLVKMESVNDQKQKLIHDVIDSRPDMFRGTVEKNSRSWMNINLRMKDEEAEAAFLTAAKKNDFIGLKGHRDVGGIRVSLYNAMSLEGTNALAEFMKEWRG
jgi:phosphoserine aminotransferase